MENSPLPMTFHFENPEDSENELTIVAEADSLRISVAEEQPVDSYNKTFECCIDLDLAAVRQLRDFLQKHYP